MSTRDVSELAEEIHRGYHNDLPRRDIALSDDLTAWVESRLQTFLAEREREWAERAEESHVLQVGAEGRVAALRGALEEALSALCWASGAPSFAPTGQAREGWIAVGKPAIDKAEAALASDAGREEAEVIREAINHFAAIDLCKGGGFADSEYDLDDVSGERLRAAVDAMLAARGGGDTRAEANEPCPDGLLPDGPECPRCGGSRAPSGIDGGTWVHFPHAARGGEGEG